MSMESTVWIKGLCSPLLSLLPSGLKARAAASASKEGDGGNWVQIGTRGPVVESELGFVHMQAGR